MEGDAGTRRLNPADAEETPDRVAVSSVLEDNADADLSVSPVEGAPEGQIDAAPGNHGRRLPRLGRGWAVTVCVVLLLLSVGAASVDTWRCVPIRKARNLRRTPAPRWRPPVTA